MTKNKLKVALITTTIIGILLVVLLIISSIYFSKATSIILAIISVLTCIIARVVVKNNSKYFEVHLPITNKMDTIEKIYNIFNLEKTNTIVFINTKDEELLKKTQDFFKGSNKINHKKNYSLILPKVTIKDLKKYYESNDPELLIIHQFANKTEQKNALHTLSICIEKELILSFDKEHFTKEEINKIEKELKSK